MEVDIRFINSLLVASPDPIGAIHAEELKLLYSNGIGEKLLGYTTEEFFRLSENNFKSIIHPNDYEEFENSTDKLLSSKEGEIISSEFSVKKSDGSYLTWLARDIVFERNKDGKALKYTSVIKDITDNVILKMNLSELEGKLNLISFKNSHDLRGPVASILGLIELIRMEDYQSAYNLKIFKHLKNIVTKLDEVIREISEMTYH